jgi:hypothetical protein
VAIPLKNFLSVFLANARIDTIPIIKENAVKNFICPKWAISVIA